MFRNLKNKRGEMYIWACVVILILVIVFSVILFSSLAVSQAQAQRKGALQALDEYTQNNAIQIYESIKMHTDDKQTLESDPYISILSEAQNLEVEDYGLVSLSADGNCRYIVSDLEVSFTVEYTTQIHASYILKIPVTLLGNEVWMDIPITISTRLNPKFDTQEETLQAYATGYVGEYDGNPHGITVTAEPADATILYGLTSDSQTLIESPTFTDVGAYIIFYRVDKEGYSPIIGSAAVIIVESPTPFAVLSADGSLVFYYRKEIPQTGDIFDGKTVSAVYTGFSTATYTSASSVPWYSDRASITSVSFASEFAAVQPVSTAYWFNGCSNLMSFNQENLDASSIKKMSYMFANCSSLTSLDLSGFSSSRPTAIIYMFGGCSSLSTLNLSGFNTSSVPSMEGLFYGCSSLTSLDLSSFITSSVTSVDAMFYGCSSLISLDLSNFNTSRTTSMSGMFYGCSSLISLDLSSFITSRTGYMDCMFYGCSSLISLNLSSFNTSSVTSMAYMFTGCSGLTSLDLSSFNTSSVKNMNNMFFRCSSLQTIYASELWSTDAVTSSTGMFSGCTKLVGGCGTAVATAKVYDATYACIDTATTPGYLTYKAAP